MSLLRTVAHSFAVLVFASACKGKSPEGGAEPNSEHADKADAASEHAEKKPGQHEDVDAAAFSVPFVQDKDDPLVRTRGFFHDALSDNVAYEHRHDPDFFRGFANEQKPRATVLTCSDSRVQSPAFDAAPENDIFFVRNIGNQIENNLGSVEYGVHHLKTSSLLILGHTGCGAVKAAMGEIEQESAAIRHELEGIHVDKRKEGVHDDDPVAWLSAVIDNVHDQVATALREFSEDVRAGRLTVVGAVYDFRNDMKFGAGKLVIVDVNGVSDLAKVQAFEQGVLASNEGSRASSSHADAGAIPVPASKGEAEVKSLTEIREALMDASTRMH